MRLAEASSEPNRTRFPLLEATEDIPFLEEVFIGELREPSRYHSEAMPSTGSLTRPLHVDIKFRSRAEAFLEDDQRVFGDGNHQPTMDTPA